LVDQKSKAQVQRQGKQTASRNFSQEQRVTTNAVEKTQDLKSAPLIPANFQSWRGGQAIRQPSAEAKEG
jgi:hypothetical protein